MALEICEGLLDTIRSDTAIQTYTGYSVSDTRIYSWNPMFNVIFSPTQKVAIFFRYNQNPLPVNFSYLTQRGDIYFYFQIKSPDKTLGIRCTERIENLFRDKPLTTDNYNVKIIECLGSSEGNVEGTVTRPVYVRNMSLKLKHVFKSHIFWE